MHSDLPQVRPKRAAAGRERAELQQRAGLSQVPTALTRGACHEVVFVNEAFARLLGGDPVQWVGRPFAELSREGERIEALLSRVLESGVTELAPDLGFNTADGGLRIGATLVHALSDDASAGARVEVIDVTARSQVRSESTQSAEELRHANSQLVLASLREHELAERAELATQRVERLLRRKSVLADAGSLLSSSLDVQVTVQRTAELGVAELSDCCVVRLLSENGPDLLGVAHKHDEQNEWLVQQLATLRCDDAMIALTARALECGEPVLTPSVTPAAASSSMLEALQARASLAVPLEGRGRVIGVMLLLASRPAHAFGQDDIEYATELARRASLAIDNARLYHDAQQAARMREDVLNIVSHDLRNPLGAITMSVQRLLRVLPQGGDDPQRVRNTCELILRSSKHMRSLIEELLDIASIQGGQLTLECQPVSLCSVLTQASEMMNGSATQHEVRLEVVLPDPDVTLACDKERVVRVIANLVGNAIKFSPPGGRICIRCRSTEQETLIEVRDEGPGIAKSEVPKLFTQYWKGEGTGRTGMGLGLYIARAIVEAHGGHIWVDSELTRGSTFKFTLRRDSAPTAT